MFASYYDKSYTSQHSFTERRAEFNKIRAKYMDKIPVIVDSNLLKTNKFLLDESLTIGQLMFNIRKSMKKVDPGTGYFMFYQNTILRSNAVIGDIFYDFQETKTLEDDGFLYFVLAKENTFGC